MTYRLKTIVTESLLNFESYVFSKLKKYILNSLYIKLNLTAFDTNGITLFYASNCCQNYYYKTFCHQ